MVRVGGDALVLHVGDRPYVVTGSGPVDLSTNPLNPGVMTGLLQQLLSPEAQHALEELGAVEHQLPSLGDDRFTVVAARSGDDIWIEIRRRRAAARPRAEQPPPAPAPAPAAAAPAAVAPQPAAVVVSAPAPPEPERPLAVVAAPTPPPAVPERAPAPPPVGGPEPTVAPAPTPPPVEPSAVPKIEFTPVPAIAASAGASVAAEEEVSDDERIVIEAEDLGVPSVAAVPAEPPRLTPARPPLEEGPAAPPPPSAVVPLTRTVRIEVPPRATPPRVGATDRLLRLAAARGATSLFLSTGAPPYVRVEGDLRPLETEPALTRADVEAAILELGPAASQSSVSSAAERTAERSGQAHEEWIVELDEIGRVRCVTFVDHRGPGVIFNLIATRAATAEQLGLAREVQALATEAEGLVIVAAPRGSGKSTLLSAFVDLVNRQRAEYVITLERQIRLVHDRRQALVSQREIRGGAEDALAAARAALRENPDVLVVDDLQLAQLVPLLVEAAGQGLLVFMSVTAPSTVDAVGRLVDLAPPDSRKVVQAALAERFRGAVAQVLVKKASGGRVAAREVLLGSSAVTRLIAEGQLSHLPAAIESGRKHGMVPLTDALVQLVQAGSVDVREAYRKAPDRERLLAALKRQGVDTSVVERLA
jgi:twitching motility protein PilT